MTSEAEQALLQPHEEQEEEEEHEFRKGLQNDLNLQQHLRSFQILRSAVNIITSNTKFMVLMILSILPFFVFLFLYEKVVPKLMDSISNVLIPPFFSWRFSEAYTLGISDYEVDYDENGPERKFFRIVLEIFPFYLILLPLLELFSLPIIINITAKIYAGDVLHSSTTFRETMNEAVYKKNNLKGPFITFVCVQLLSTCTLVCVFWTVVSHHFIAHLPFLQNSCLSILSLGFNAVIFLGLLYKYLEWSVLWNMAMVISVLQMEAGLNALEISAYYGKHCKRTGFQLMLVFIAYSVVLRLPFLIARACDVGIVGVVVTAIVAGLVCLGSLGKWVATVLYFYDCKAQMLSKKIDEEIGKVGKVVDVCRKLNFEGCMAS